MAIDLRGNGSVVMQGPVVSASEMAPATATYGPTGATVVQSGSATHPANLKVYIMAAALLGLVFIRQSAPGPRRGEVDRVVVLAFLTDLGVIGALRMNAQRKVMHGETSGIGGVLSQAGAVG